MGHRVTESLLEVFSTPVGTERVTETFLEAFHTPMGTERVTELFLEIFYSPSTVVVTQTPSGGGHHKVYIPTPNCWDCLLALDAHRYRRLDLHPPECPSIEDWDGRTIPAVGEEFFLTQAITTPPTISGDNVVVQFTPGPGQQAILYGLVCWYTGTGFVPGSGDIIWRLKVGRAWARNRGKILTPQGSPGGPWPVQDYFYVGEGQPITLYVNVPNSSGAIQIGGSYILCSLQGWTFPVT